MRFVPVAFSPHRLSEVDSVQTLEKLRGLATEDKTETEMLRSRVDEQSSLICILKQGADEMLLRCRSLQKMNTDLEDRVAVKHKELDLERKKSTIFERRFTDLASNHEKMIAFMNDYKRQNARLELENKHLRSENETLFSQKLQDKEVLVDKLTQEIKQLSEKYTNKDNEYCSSRKEIVEWQSKFNAQTTLYQSREKSLCDELQDTQQQLKKSVEMCKDLKLQLKKAGDDYALTEIRVKESITSLTKEKDKFLNLSMERGKVIQEKQEEIHLLEAKWNEEKKARIKAEERFKREAAAVNAHDKVKALQRALDESLTECEKLKKDFEAYKEHTTSLLKQEKELNAKLRHVIG
ncbi:coiled-coil domain-containing protein 89 isoform X2 [Myripristis murdjan]|uniref:coiled-coil domain-containing protein 89 isoform X2 n=1 Tax=Myripristis murdjan TaxID=586833 RepID=UPI001175F4C9|nr:coiled-coil domain-containing protein 89 isoform X2 [Myripristis murdjan]